MGGEGQVSRRWRDDTVTRYTRTAMAGTLEGTTAPFTRAGRGGFGYDGWMGGEGREGREAVCRWGASGRVLCALAPAGAWVGELRFSFCTGGRADADGEGSEGGDGGAWPALPTSTRPRAHVVGRREKQRRWHSYRLASHRIASPFSLLFLSQISASSSRGLHPLKHGRHLDVRCWWL